MKQKKGQSASNAAAFIAVVTVVIILYILFLPPDERAGLLGSDTGGTTNIGTTTGAGTSKTLFTQQVGKISYVNTNEKTYDIPTVRIYSPTSAQIIKAVAAVSIRNAVFDKESASYTMDFDIDRSLTKNILLSFSVGNSRGPLTITLNGKVIFSSELSTANPKPIVIDPSYLSNSNTIVFSVGSPGWTFWSANMYDLENVQITGDVTDTKNSAALQYFTITQSEKDNLESILLYFSPVCTVSGVAPLEIELNRKLIFNSIADCGTKSFATLDKNYILPGANELRFTTSTGSYLLDNMNVKLTFSKPTYNTYFFDMSSDYFTVKPEDAICGDSDGVCPVGCHETQDVDCCFRLNEYWCAIPTNNLNDRCVSYVDKTDCGICMTGYYDQSGDAPKNCEGLCGDNNDGVCPSNCPSPAKYYDKDCCYKANPDNFWCRELPISGLPNKCTAYIASSQCQECYSGYEDDGGSTPQSCTGDIFTFKDESKALLDIYEVRLIVRFADDTTRKRVDININGYKISIDTTDIEYTKVINDYVRQGTNTIEIIPKEDITIADISAEVRQIK